MARRLVDLLLATIALLGCGPILLLAALGIRLSSAGPIFYRARRAGRGNRVFSMFKLRTMHVDQASFQSRITAAGDPRVFAVGRLLRRLKVDELPQLLNIIRGEMAIVGPRPEDPRIVREHFAPAHLETLAARPGLASPGSIYNYTHGEGLLDPADPERSYVDRLMPIKLALDTVYVRHASLGYDARIVARTIWVIACSALGRRAFRDPPEMAEAVGLIQPARGGSAVDGSSRVEDPIESA